MIKKNGSNGRLSRFFILSTLWLLPSPLLAMGDNMEKSSSGVSHSTPQPSTNPSVYNGNHSQSAASVTGAAANPQPGLGCCCSCEYVGGNDGESEVREMVKRGLGRSPSSDDLQMKR